jgi:hypothetical protein
MGVAKKRPRKSLATKKGKHLSGTDIPESKSKQKRKRPSRLAAKLLEVRAKQHRHAPDREPAWLSSARRRA